jgi:acetoin utilization protein AcuB
MQVREIMSGNVTTIEASQSCLEAVGRMHRARIRHLPVVDADGRLVGIVTDRDLRHRLFTSRVLHEIGSVPVDALLRGVPVSEIMSTPVVTAAPTDDLEGAASLMLEDKVGSLPVVEAGRVVGIVTETDLLRRIVQADSRCPEVDDIIVSYP